MNMLTLDKLTARPDEAEVLRGLARQARTQSHRLYLVGGTLRDVLLGRHPTDWDFAVAGDLLAGGQAYADLLGGRLVLLDEERLPTLRVVQKSPLRTFDFAQLRAEDIEQDLRRRDLTLNALAVDLATLVEEGSAELIDPCGGFADLEQKRLRFTSEDSVLTDPLRMLRAYRFSAQLDWSLSDPVQQIISRWHNRLGVVSVERVRDEWCKLLDAPRATPVLRQMDETGLLAEIIPELSLMKGVVQNDYHHLDVWEHTLLAVETFENRPIPDSLLDYRAEIRTYLRGKIVYDKRRRMLLKLGLLLHDIAKPATRSVSPRGRVRFIGHEKVGSDMAKQICDRLCLGGKVKAFVGTLIYNHLRMMYFAKLREPSSRAIRRFIRHTGENWLGVLLLSHADLFASQGDARTDEDTQLSLDIMRQIADAYYQELESLVQQPRLIRGDDLLAVVHHPPGRWVGQTLKRIEDMQFNGEVRTKEEALQAACDYLRELGLHP